MYIFQGPIIACTTTAGRHVNTDIRYHILGYDDDMQGVLSDTFARNVKHCHSNKSRV